MIDSIGLDGSAALIVLHVAFVCLAKYSVEHGVQRCCKLARLCRFIRGGENGYPVFFSGILDEGVKRYGGSTESKL